MPVEVRRSFRCSPRSSCNAGQTRHDAEDAHRQPRARSVSGKHGGFQERQVLRAVRHRGAGDGVAPQDCRGASSEGGEPQVDAAHSHRQVRERLFNRADGCAARIRQVGALLADNLQHPSLHAKKYDESTGLWQARVNRSWRFYSPSKGKPTSSTPSSRTRSRGGGRVASGHSRWLRLKRQEHRAISRTSYEFISLRR